jgi:hypothetical protein
MTQDKKSHYEIQVEYFVATEDENGMTGEVKKTETIKVAHLSKHNRVHSRIAMMALMLKDDISPKIDLAEKFIDYVVDADAETKKDIKNDLISCIKIFHNEKVLEDFNNFFVQIGLLRSDGENVAEESNYKKDIKKYLVDDPYLREKGMIMRVLGFSLSQIEELSIEEIMKWKTVAEWIKLEVDFLPFKRDKN